MGCLISNTRWCPEVNAYVGKITLGDIIWEIRIRQDDYAGPNGLTVQVQACGDIYSPKQDIHVDEYALGISYAAPVGSPDLWNGEKKS